MSDREGPEGSAGSLSRLVNSNGVWEACGKGPEPLCWDELEATKNREVDSVRSTDSGQDAFLAEKQV